MSFLEDYQLLDKLLKDYGNYIDTWYISPPFGDVYASRPYLATDISNYKELQKQITIIKNYHKNIQLAINAINLVLNHYNINLIENDFLTFCELFGTPDSIVCLDQFIPILKSYNIPITYSYNNNYCVTKFKNLNDCDTIVLGNKDIRNLKFMAALKQKYGVKIELLVNNGCHFLCNRNCTQDCQKLQLKRLEVQDLITCLAEQSLLPEELNFYPNHLIDYYKISSRPSDYDYLNKTLSCYTQRLSLEEICKIIDLRYIDNWKYFMRLIPLSSLFSSEEKINLDLVMYKKEEIWNKILTSKEKCDIIQKMEDNK